MVVNGECTARGYWKAKGSKGKGKGHHGVDRDVACYTFGRRGHMMKEVWSKPSGKGKGTKDTKALVKHRAIIMHHESVIQARTSSASSVVEWDATPKIAP